MVDWGPQIFHIDFFSFAIHNVSTCKTSVFEGSIEYLPYIRPPLLFSRPQQDIVFFICLFFFFIPDLAFCSIHWVSHLIRMSSLVLSISSFNKFWGICRGFTAFLTSSSGFLFLPVLQCPGIQIRSSVLVYFIMLY